MTFWIIFCPVFAALIAHFMITELFNVALGYYLHKKQERLRKEFEAKVASGEIDPTSMLMGGFPSPGMDFPSGLPTASGEASAPEVSHGQYL